MVFFQFLRSQVQSVSSGIGQQQQIASGVLDTIKGYIPKVQSAWIGGDADAFAADVNRKIVPAMMELIAAIGGVNLNLSKATGIVDQADAKSKSMADQLGDQFSQI
jgi:WXG100 family type VII secretion target